MARPDAADPRKPAPLIVRLVALSLLDDAHDAARRFRRGDGTDPELLHDFRVAVRRLRSWMRLWHDALADAVRRRDGRRIRRVARATGAARDLDVHLEWLAVQHDAACPAEQPAIAAVIERLEAERPAATTDARRAAKRLTARHRTLARRLARYHVDVREAVDAAVPFGVALAPVVAAAADALEARLAAVTSPDDHEGIHEARIAAKRLRYLLEPVAASVCGASDAVEALKSLQDHAGALHDSHVFAAELARDDRSGSGGPPPLLARRLGERAGEEYAALERAWLHGAAAPFLARVRAIGAAAAP